MTREIGPELVARIRHVADSLEAIARGEVDSPQPVEQTQNVGPAPAECSRSERGSARPSADSVGGAGPTFQEPVAWAILHKDHQYVNLLRKHAEAHNVYVDAEIVPLYRSPTLTAEEREAVLWSENVLATILDGAGRVELAAAAEIAKARGHAATLRNLLEKTK